MSRWTRTGASEKAQASQTIGILMNTLLYFADEVSNDYNSLNSYVKTGSTVIKSMFSPSKDHNMNEQISVLFNTLGWKNSEIRLQSSERAKIILGSNRYLDQNQNTIKGLEVLVKMIATAVGYHLFDRDVDALVDIDIMGPIYTIELQALSSLKTDISPKTKSTPKSTPVATKSTPSSPAINTSEVSFSSYDTSQIFLPILNNRLPQVTLHRILKEVLVEFCKSWYSENPISDKESDDDKNNLVILILYITQKAVENNISWVSVGEQVGGYFAQALSKNFPNEQLIVEEILETMSLGSIIRDVKSRSLCPLNLGQTCGNKIGGENRGFCDFVMGLWAGSLSQITGKKYSFTGFYPTGKRSTDPCLMEFTIV